MVNNWSKIILDVANIIIPKTIVREENSAPWIDGETINLSNKKETKRRKERRTGRERHWRTYKEYNQRLQLMIHRQFNEYVAECTNKINTNPKQSWTMVGTKTGDRGYPDTMKMQEKQAENDQGIAELFNQFFASVFTKGDAQDVIPDLAGIPNPNLIDITLETDEVQKVLEELNPNKAIGPDNIPARILKECAEVLAPNLTRIFNKSLHDGKVPDSWKIANVCPVFKKEEKTDIENYRPISLLSIASKCLERCIFNRIILHVGPQLSSHQHGFIAGKSTVIQLLEVYNYISKVIDNRGQVDTIFLDLSKAFDSVSHPHLLEKLWPTS